MKEGRKEGKERMGNQNTDKIGERDEGRNWVGEGDIFQ